MLFGALLKFTAFRDPDLVEDAWKKILTLAKSSLCTEFCTVVTV
jgi:hypothetical protein